MSFKPGIHGPKAIGPGPSGSDRTRTREKWEVPDQLGPGSTAFKKRLSIHDCPSENLTFWEFLVRMGVIIFETHCTRAFRLKFSVMHPRNWFYHRKYCGNTQCKWCIFMGIVGSLNVCNLLQRIKCKHVKETTRALRDWSFCMNSLKKASSGQT